MKRAGVAFLFLVLACASDSSPVGHLMPAGLALTPELEVAKLRLQRAQDDAVLTARAGAEVRRAGQALDRAAEALHRGASPEEVAPLANCIERRLDFARWIAARNPGEADAFGELDARAPLATELESIRAELEARYVDAERGAGALVVTLPRRLFGQSELRSLAKTMLDRVADVLSRHPELRISIVGYTDDMGSDAYDREVSQQRAEAVAGYLALRGLARSTMSVRGAGNSEPRVPNTTSAGRRINRRVELRVEAAGA